MKKITLLLFCSFFAIGSFAQKLQDIINSKEVTRVEYKLASDDMRGRKVFTPDIDRAATFIAQEFKSAGLQYFDHLPGYWQTFSMSESKVTQASGKVNGHQIASEDITAFTLAKNLKVNQESGFQVTVIDSGSSTSFFRIVYPLLRKDKPQLVFIHSSFRKSFERMKTINFPMFPSQPPVVLVLYDGKPDKYQFAIKSEIHKKPLSNVVGVLPGKSLKNEYVVFSAHYDHLGVGKPNAQGDSIYNGANDDASGTTAVIMLAKYFAQKGGNERTLIFTTFTAEEAGGYGSRYFSEQLDPASIVAMFNIEMIGTPSKWGYGSAYITGYEKSDFGKILQENIPDSSFVFHPDPYTKQNLFYRSDNATLAALGVPAHTISTSKMDNEPNYHKVTDEVSTLDMKQMTQTIWGIAESAQSIISGKDTPTRVKELK